MPQDSIPNINKQIKSTQDINKQIKQIQTKWSKDRVIYYIPKVYR